MSFSKSTIFSGFIQANPIPSQGELIEYYQEEFYQSAKPDLLNDSSLEVRDKDALFYNIQYSIFFQLLGLASSSNHVDLGCGFGHFLKYISKENPNTKLTGCEVYMDAKAFVDQIGGATFRILDLDDFNPKDSGISDAETLSLVNALEHLRKPQEFLHKCYEEMTVGSRLLIQVPNDFNRIQKAVVDEMCQDEWWFCPPRHISYFSPEGISELTTSIGFKVIDLITTFPIDMLLLSGINYRAQPELGRQAHSMRLNFEVRYIKSNGLTALIDLYRNFAAAGIGREIIILVEK